MYKYSDGTVIYDENDEKEIKKLLIGHKVEVIENNGQEAELELDNGIRLKVLANEGCGGCSNGWYSINNLNNIDNAITNVEFECDDLDPRENDWDDTSYKIFVFCEDKRINLLDVTGSDDNGYYGTGYTIRVIKTIKE